MDKIETMVGEKMAQKLIDSIGDILGPPDPKKLLKSKKEGDQASLKEKLSVEEITLPSGEKQSRIIKRKELEELLASKKEKQNPASASPINSKEKVADDRDMKMLDIDVEKKILNEATSPEDSVSLDPRSDLSEER